MQVILLKNIDKLGDKHEVVKVKDGFGRNYLIPQEMAIVANSSNLKQLGALIQRQEAAENKRLDEYKVIAEQLKSISLKIGAKAGTSGRIFGSVTSIQLSQALRAQANIDIERKKIHLNDEIKEIGTYSARIDLHKEVSVTINFEVVAE